MVYEIDKREGNYEGLIDPDELQYNIYNAFPLSIRKLFKIRSGGRSELSGRRDRPMECSHIDHDKRNPNYNSLLNGMRVADIEHAAYHEWASQTGQDIGLTDAQNRWSIGQILSRVNRYNDASGLDMEVDKDLEFSVNLWQMFWDMLTNRVEVTEIHLQDRN